MKMNAQQEAQLKEYMDNLFGALTGEELSAARKDLHNFVNRLMTAAATAGRDQFINEITTETKRLNE